MRLPLTIAVLGAALLWLGVPAAQGEYRGKLVIRHSDDFARKRTHTGYRLLRHGRSIPLVLARAPRIASGSAVVVRGRRAGSAIRGTVRPRGIAHAATVANGARKTAVILINFASDTRQPWTSDYVRQRVFTATDSTNAFYVEESGGNVSLTGKTRSDGDVYGWYTISATTAGCNVDEWARQAKAAAAADGFSSTGYQHIVYAFPSQSSCGGWAGLGELPGKQSWMNGNISTRVVTHELGHNMGLHHASSLSCTADGAAVAYSSTCTADEYGDPFDVMGSRLRRNNAWHLQQIGFMPPANVQVAASSGTYTIASALTPGAGTKLLRVPRTAGASSEYYDLELRSSGGVFDNFLSTDPAVQGVTIHMDPDPSVITQSMLLDTTPGSGSGFSDAPLAPGRTFSDGVVSISVRSVSGGTAIVDVAGAPDTTPPSEPGPLAAEPAADRVTLSWPASTDDVGVAGYRVLRDGNELTTTSELTFTDTAVTPGTTYSYRVVALDAAGNTAASAPVSATVPEPPRPAPETSSPPADSTAPPQDSTTPTAPPITGPEPPLVPADSVPPVVQIASPARRARVRRRAVVRASALDAGGVVRTEVWVDGALRKSVDGGRLAWRWPLRGARPGRHLVVVRAFDAAGNHGWASARVRVIP
jgi:M6 family metalloprotease-like protein